MKINCKHKLGYYRYFTTRGKGYCVYEPDGSEGDNTQMFDGLTIIEQKTKYCLECHQKLRGGNSFQD